MKKRLPPRFVLAARYHAALLRSGTLASAPEQCAALALRHADALASLSLHYEGKPAPSAAAVSASARRGAPGTAEMQQELGPERFAKLYGAVCDVCKRSAPAEYVDVQCAAISGICLGIMRAAPAAPGGK